MQIVLYITLGASLFKASVIYTLAEVSGGWSYCYVVVTTVVADTHAEGFLGDNRIRKLEGFREEITRSNFTPNWIVKLFGQLIRINDLSD